MQRPVAFPQFAFWHANCIRDDIDEHLCEIIEPIWWECMLANNGLYAISHCKTSFVEVFAFFHPEHVNVISSTGCVREKHHVGSSCQEQANGLYDALTLQCCRLTRPNSARP